jgi:hypothetical protein
MFMKRQAMRFIDRIGITNMRYRGIAGNWKREGGDHSGHNFGRRMA